MRRLLVLAAALLATVDPAAARKPLSPAQATIVPGFGYILVRLQPGTTSTVMFSRFTMRGNVVSIVSTRFDAASPKAYDSALVGGDRTLERSIGSATYLVPVRPGSWLISMVNDTSFSLGTYGFSVAPGQITDIGTLMVGREDGRSPIPEIAASRLSSDLAGIKMSDALLLRPVAAADAVPAVLSRAKVAPAVFVADLRFPNVYGTLINRALGLPPMAHIQPAGYRR